MRKEKLAQVPSSSLRQLLLLAGVLSLSKSVECFTFVRPLASRASSCSTRLNENLLNQLWSTLAPPSPSEVAPSEDDNNDHDHHDDKVDIVSQQMNNFQSISTNTGTRTSVTSSETTSTITDSSTTSASSSSSRPAPGTAAALSMTLDELGEVLGGRGRAQLVWDCYSIGVDPMNFFGPIVQNLGHDDFESIYEQLPTSRRHNSLGTEALDKLSKLYSQEYGEKVTQVEGAENGVAALSYVSTSADGTTKLLLKLHDGLQVETVIIPWKGARSTLCISSQVGCKQGCTFCATGKMGKVRDLSTDEILAQLFFAQKIIRWNNDNSNGHHDDISSHLPPVSNIVFMGMGEPADNADAVIKATEILTARELFQLSASKVTVSTVAPTPEAFQKFAKAPCVLAWSVHAVDDELRRQLVPTTKHSMNELRQGFIDALLSRPLNFRTAMIEIVLIDQVNDSVDDANQVVDFVNVIKEQVPGSKIMVNLIPYNSITSGTKTTSTTTPRNVRTHDEGREDDVKASSSSPKSFHDYEKPSEQTVLAFQQHLQSREVFAHVRNTRGDDESAACGQLATSKGRNGRQAP